MLRLSLARAPFWLELPYGVRVQVEPLTTAIDSAARNDALRRVAAEMEEAKALAKAGQGHDPLAFNPANMAACEGKADQYEIEALARFGIKAWEGVSDEAGEPLPVNPASIQAFAQHTILGRAFRDTYRKAVEMVSAEGEGFAPSFDGDGKVARNTAEAATNDQPMQKEDAAADAEPAPAS